jgi:hypothetical protein
MSKDDAEAARVPEKDRRGYFRIDRDAKSNMRPAAQKADWRKFVSVCLDNATPEDPSDWVGVVTAWQMPGLFDDMAANDLFAIQKEIAAGEWRADPQSPDWAGNAVAKVLNLDVSNPAEKKRIKARLKAWIENGALKEAVRKDAKRKDRIFIEVGKWAM